MKQPPLLIEYLKAVRNTDKPASLVIVVLISLQLIFTIVKLEAAPFFLFGMFSEKMPTTDTFSTVRIFVNDKPITSFNLPHREKNLLETTTLNYIEMKRNGGEDLVKTRIENRYAIIYNAAFYPVLSKRIYNEARQMDGFKDWLKTKCLRIAGVDNATIQIVESTYLLNNDSPVPTRIKNEILETI